MRTVFVRVTPTLPVGDNHPAFAIQALRGIRVPFDLSRLAGYLGRHQQLPPSTAYLAIPLNDAVEGLAMLNRIEALIYWRDVARPYYIAISAVSCDLEDGDVHEFLRRAA